MANCSTCGTSTGIMGPKECASCRDKREAQESATSERQRAAEVAEARQELLAIRQEIFDDEYEQVAATVAGGADAFLYRSVYVAVDSIHDEQEIADEFDIEPVRMLGRMGWEAVSVVPRTLGTSPPRTSRSAPAAEEHTAVGSAARLSACMFCSGTGLRWRTCRPRSASWLAAADSTSSPRRGCRLHPDVSRVAPKRGVGRRSGHVEGARMGQVRFHARRFDLGLRARIQQPRAPTSPTWPRRCPGAMEALRWRHVVHRACPAVRTGAWPSARGEPCQPRRTRGRGPGRDRDRRGDAFRRHSGTKVLWPAVAEADLNEADLYVVSSVACRPYNPAHPSVRAPSPDAILAAIQGSSTRSGRIPVR